VSMSRRMLAGITAVMVCLSVVVGFACAPRSQTGAGTVSASFSG